MTLREEFEREIKESSTSVSLLFKLSNKEYIEWLETQIYNLRGEYPIQDDIWPSRRWKRDLSDYEDLSGQSDN